MGVDRLYTGQRYIAELGIYHYNARFYSPILGRFLSADTLMSGFANPQNLNRFSYVANNPLRYTDPMGHRACDDFDVMGGCYTAPGGGGMGFGGVPSDDGDGDPDGEPSNSSDEEPSNSPSVADQDCYAPWPWYCTYDPRVLTYYPPQTEPPETLWLLYDLTVVDYFPPVEEENTAAEDLIPELLPYNPGISGFDANQFWNDVLSNSPIIGITITTVEQIAYNIMRWFPIVVYPPNMMDDLYPRTYDS